MNRKPLSRDTSWAPVTDGGEEGRPIKMIRQLRQEGG
jgi:hypothetical protein